MNELPDRDAFAKQLNLNFVMHLEDGTTRQIELIEVTELIKIPPQETFSLIFLAPLDTPIEQRLYTLENENLGKMDLFLVPIKQIETGLKFQAVFSTLNYD